MDAFLPFALAYLHIRLHMSCTEEESEFQHSLGCSSPVQSPASKQTNKQAFVLALQPPNLGDVELRLLLRFLVLPRITTAHSRNIHTCLARINFDFTGRNGCLGSGEGGCRETQVIGIAFWSKGVVRLAVLRNGHHPDCLAHGDKNKLI